ncbi:vicilin-like seed storage protein At2g28490 [Olea europaea var. sylvestris]|uniref:vicilin-like seed storage protein At2g28490 n=1 Tax=Olea europaea var. sylvestris TaxID=158386 RepID=UPI000C1D3CBA|nr:vicilin-like seed storage protein At2g28490 [Olea europaea var. sylvestris]
MGKRSVSSFLILVVLCSALVAIVGGAYEDEGRRWETGGGAGAGGGEEGGAGMRQGQDQFLLQDSEYVVKTDAGDVRVVRGVGGRFIKSPLHIGFITMEPKSLFIPQYLDSSLVLFVRRGKAKIGHIYKDKLVEKKLETGDIYRIGAGFPFYINNTAEGQRLHIICSIDTSDSLGLQPFQSFYIGGGKYPVSVLSGFDRFTLSMALNVSIVEVEELLSRQMGGPIVFHNVSYSPRTKFLDLENYQKLAEMKRIVHIGKDSEEEEKKQPRWTLRKFLMTYIFGSENEEREDKRGSSDEPDPFNIYDRNPDFKNDYGWSIALDKSDYSPLDDSDLGIFLVNLSAGSMMAPHYNPTATEYGIVLKGTGTIQVASPDGSLAMNAEVKEGDVFFIPRFFPFCQIASRTGPFEFFGFSSSARNNRPQFLAGDNSILKKLRGPELAKAFGLSEERLDDIVDARSGSVIFPSAVVAPPEVAKMSRTFGNDKITDFN